jgi:hypothetical protein
MNNLLTSVNYGVKRFKHFRKKLVLDYKKGSPHDHKNPHAIPLELKQKLLNVRQDLCSPKREAIGRRSENSKGKA